jgi:hypothetical protein
MRLALISDGKVVNVIIADQAFADSISDQYDHVVDVTNLNVGPGYLYDGTNFSAPPPYSPPSGPLQPPTAIDDDFSTPQNTALSVVAPGIFGNDVLNGATVVENTNPANGTLTLNADGSFLYVPVADFIGIDSFTYTIANNAGKSVATVTIDVS